MDSFEYLRNVPNTPVTSLPVYDINEIFAEPSPRIGSLSKSPAPRTPKSFSSSSRPATNPLAVVFQAPVSIQVSSPRSWYPVVVSGSDTDLPDLVNQYRSESVAVLLNPETSWTPWPWVPMMKPRAMSRFYCGPDDPPISLLVSTKQTGLREPAYLVSSFQLAIADPSATSVRVSIEAAIQLLHNRPQVDVLIIPESLIKKLA